MDPLSIAASTLGLADITARLVGRVAKFVRDSKNVDEVLRSFCNEISTLDINLRLVGRTILSHPDLSHIADNQDFLSAIQNTVGNIERTINTLKKFLDEIPTNESSNALQRFLRQRKLDKALPDIARLRLEMVSYNSSLQTVLQAIDISISMSIKTQNNPDRFADEFFRATKSLDDKLAELRSDILKVLETSRPGEQHEAPAQIDPVVSSMHIAQRFAERVYSKASTISTTHSDLASHHRPGSRVSYDDLPSQYVPNKVPGRETSFRPSGLVDMELLQAQASLEEARAKYGIGELKDALDLCSDALEELSEVQSTPVNAYIEYTVLLQALIQACIGTTEALVESRRLLKTVDAQQLQSVATDDLVLARMALFSWAKFNLSEFEEAEIICRTLIRDARNWNGDTNNDNLNDANTLLALLHFCQNRRRKGQSLSRIIPSDYLRSKFDEAFSASEHDLAFDANERDMLELLRRLSQPWCRYAAFYYIHHVHTDIPGGLLLRAAAQYGSVPVIAMLTAGRTSALTTPICACHGVPICKDKKALKSPWELAVNNLQFGAVSFMIDSLGILCTLDSVDSTIRAAIKVDTPKMFQFFQDLQSKKADVWNGPDVLNRPLFVGIQCCAQDTVEHLIRHDSKLDLNEVDQESGLTLMGLACRNNLGRVVRLLIERGVDIEAYCGFGKRPIYVAVEAGSFNALDRLIENGATIDSTPTPDKQWRIAFIEKCQRPVTLTPLQLSFGICGKIDNPGVQRDISLELLKRGADPTIDYDIEKSCLHLAMEHDPSLFDLIARETPEVFNRAFDGETFLQQMLDRMRPLEKNYHEDDYDGYYDAITTFHASISRLVASGSDPMALYADDQTCFHRAVRQEDCRLLEELLKSKKPIDINHEDAHGHTAADIACDIANMEIRMYILSELAKAGAVIPVAEEENLNAFLAPIPKLNVLKLPAST